MKNQKDKKTFVTQVRCDIVDIATIAKFYKAKKMLPTNRSALISQALHHLAEIIIKQNLNHRCVDTKAAIRTLRSYGLYNRDMMRTKRLLSNLIEENATSFLDNEDETLKERAERIKRELINKQERNEL